MKQEDLDELKELLKSDLPVTGDYTKISRTRKAQILKILEKYETA